MNSQLKDSIYSLCDQFETGNHELRFQPVNIYYETVNLDLYLRQELVT